MKPTFKFILSHFLILIFSVLLSGCSFFSPVKSIPATTYFVVDTPDNVPVKRKRRIILMVATPETKPAYNTTDMVYSTKPYEIAYYAKNRWAETPSQMLQPLIAETLRETHHFKAVVTPPYIGNYNYVLNTQIMEFEQDFTTRPAFFRLKINAQLSKVSLNHVIAFEEFEIEVPLRCPPPYGGVIAANRATTLFLQRLAYFVLAKIH